MRPEHMKAGPELDKLVADVIMNGKEAPYSSMAEHVWRVVERVSKDHYPFVLVIDRYTGGYSGGRWLCSFTTDIEVFTEGPFSGDTDALNYWYRPPNEDPPTICAGDTPAHAICLAALQVYGVKV